MSAVVTWLTLVALTGGGVQNAQAPATGTARIEGIVVRGDTDQPLSGALVRLVRWDGGQGRQFSPVRSGEDGRFVFEHLPEGSYALSFSAEGFVGLDLGQRRPQEAARRVVLAEGAAVTNVRMTLPRTSAIEGWVVDEFGDPVPGVAVQAARVQYAAGKHRLTPSGPSTLTTDDLGRFRIFNLPPGEYYLMALAGPFGAVPPVGGFAVTYYPGTSVPMDAQAIPVDVGRDVTGVSFQLTPAPTWSVSGAVVDEQGASVQAEVMLLPTSGGDVRALIMSRLPGSPDGRFEFRNVPAGAYVVQAYGRPVGGGNLALSPFGATPIMVEGPLDSVRVQISTGSILRGRIVFDGDGPRPTPDRVSVFPAPVNFMTGPVGGGPPRSVVAPDWTFETSNMTGSRVVRVNVGLAGWVLARVTRDGVDISDNPIHFDGSDVGGIEVTLTNRTGAVRGTVTEANAPVSEASVLVFAEDPARREFPSRYLASVRPGVDGAFTVQGLLPGEYLVLAVPPVVGGDWQDPAVLAAWEGLATRVSVGAGGAATVALRLHRR